MLAPLSATTDARMQEESMVPPDTAKAAVVTALPRTTHPLIFEAAFAPATLAVQGADSLRFSVSDLGRLKSESGTLVACDPINVHDAQGFAQLFPKGQFPVQLALARFRHDERVAFSRVVFSAAPVVRWQLATLPGQPPLALDDAHTYCYPVDAGAGIFADKQASDAFAAQDQATWKAVFVTKAAENGYRGFLHPFGKYNLATFSTGLGDGCYSSYIGYDRTGHVCRLLTDFGLVNW
ncbi:DUF4241 domain-containing protein [Hymenobacter negativus]|uniref:DUF4241 domain-containing protein n=1 Tax=Hymenobacter negativus TaxID=2795026 RepID=A0ABS3Q9N4_9BACT|nr:DUF4241 domain-containing protein [Hymenobacter negativus]MBO2007948.1 DUF4241 domain-containing protein [Hymenobacter negativus]